tara:strand:- start:648 stop:1055 length:408 start_codon:yes stop_codon:yes gene_type:complete
MALELECLQRLGVLFLPIEEKRVEKFLAHSLTQTNYKYEDLDLVYSSKNFRVFYKIIGDNVLQISISKKNFKSAVERNKIKRRVREVFREKSLLDLVNGVVVFSVFKPFGELSYLEALLEIESAIGLCSKARNEK